MKRVVAVIAIAVLVVAMSSMVFAADMQKGTIKSVDAKAGTIVLAVDGGKDETLKADKSVDLGSAKAGDKVEVSVENGTVMSMKAAAVKRAPVGC